MARPLPAHPTPPRIGNNGSIPSLAANLTLARADDDEAEVVGPDWQEGAVTPADPVARENAALGQQLAEAQKLIAELKQEAEQALQDQQVEFERILEEKSEIIRLPASGSGPLHFFTAHLSHRPLP